MFYLYSLLISIVALGLIGWLLKGKVPARFLDWIFLGIFIVIFSFCVEILSPKGMISCKLTPEECQAAFEQLQHFSWERLGYYLKIHGLVFVPIFLLLHAVRFVIKWIKNAISQ